VVLLLIAAHLRLWNTRAHLAARLPAGAPTASPAAR
jgi:hypothetical protein